MTPETTTAALLALAVAAAWWRLAAWWRGAPVGARPQSWRIASLALGQPVLATLLFLTLFPPLVAAPSRTTLTVATRGTARLALLAAGADLVALPEASAPTGTTTAPDLATALRRHPGTARLRVLGEGLEPRDIEAARGLAVTFDPPPIPRGLIALAPPAPVAPGGDFRVGGAAAGVRGTAELLDPGDARVAVTPLDADGRFVLTGAARVPGPALFRIRLRDTGGGIVEDADVPVVTAVTPPPHILYLAGAPGPSVKYWRRWALDAGLDADVRESVGAGLELGDRGAPIGAAMLARYDLVIADDRSWATLGSGERAALVAAVRGGLGLLLRATGPLPAPVRGGWAALGMPVGDGIATAPVRSSDATAPELTRRILPLAAPQFVPLLHDAGGAVLVGWRSLGRGRVGLSSVTDDFMLVTSGHGDRFGADWGEIIGALSRPRPASTAQIEALPRAMRRVSICGVRDGAVATLSDGRVSALLPDAAAGGCAGLWPGEPGWVTLRQDADSTPFYVYPSAALPGIRAVERRNATLLLSNAAGDAVSAGTEQRRSPYWPWLIAFVALAAALWWLERARLGRARTTREGG